GGDKSTLTDSGGGFAFSSLAEADYTLCEAVPVQTNWVQTAPPQVCFTVHVPSVEAQSCSLDFGNLCLGAGGGHTLGFWGNNNGQAAFLGTDAGASALALLQSLNLRNATGAAFDPTSYAQFKTWLQGANAQNMAYMLSVQLAAMEMNVLRGFVNGSVPIQALGTSSANPAGFATVS